MAYLNTTFQTVTNPQYKRANLRLSTSVTSTTFLLQFGKREIRIRKDFRKRFYPTHPFIECRAGVNPGHVEILLLRCWVIIFSKAQNWID